MPADKYIRAYSEPSAVQRTEIAGALHGHVGVLTTPTIRTDVLIGHDREHIHFDHANHGKTELEFYGGHALWLLASVVQQQSE